MDKYDFGLILKDIGNFDISNFDGRLILQKTVYVLKAFKINLGYEYNWYLHGTYSPELARAGYQVSEIIDKIPDIAVKFQDENVQTNYDNFKGFIADKKDNPDLLEISSSICYLFREDFKKDEILELVENKKARFKKDDCVKIWNELQECEVVKN